MEACLGMQSAKKPCGPRCFLRFIRPSGPMLRTYLDVPHWGNGEKVEAGIKMSTPFVRDNTAIQ
jgi:hypothetical protein